MSTKTEIQVSVHEFFISSVLDSAKAFVEDCCRKAVLGKVPEKDTPRNWEVRLVKYLMIRYQVSVEDVSE